MTIFTQKELEDLRAQLAQDPDIPANIKTALDGLDDNVIIALYEGFTGDKVNSGQEIKRGLALACDKALNGNILYWQAINEANAVSQIELGYDVFTQAKVTAFEDFIWRVYDSAILPIGYELVVPPFDDPSNPDRQEFLDSQIEDV